MLTPGAAFAGAFAGKTVLITGHTGFKGAWLAMWLLRLGARVVGYALPPSGAASVFAEAGLASRLTHLEGDVRDRAGLAAALAEHRPEVVFHLAAQALVRLSYLEPAETYDVNVMGTVNLLEAVRAAGGVRACVVVTSDKCYENREWPYAYRENDAMGGHDPYSSSKGCAELVTAAYRDSFFPPAAHARHGVGVASARAGNVIGGGDWAQDRILPDCVRALARGEAIEVRNPEAVRPWQHVLEPLSGYLWLAARLLADGPRYAGGWNFGPGGAGNVTVREVVERVVACWGSGNWHAPPQVDQPHEARTLKLDVAKAGELLPWRPTFDLDEALRTTVDWYRSSLAPGFDGLAATLDQIASYERLAAARGAAWAAPARQREAAER